MIRVLIVRGLVPVLLALSHACWRGSETFAGWAGALMGRWWRP